MSLPSDAAHKRHMLDLMQVKNVPRYDSVSSTEGDLATNPESTNRTDSGQPVCDFMHPRLRARAEEWAKQFVVFETAASYPMFIITVTKKQVRFALKHLLSQLSMCSRDSFADKLMMLLRDRKEDEEKRISALELARKEVDVTVSY